MQSLDAPTARYKFSGQPIEQLRVARGLPLLAEIAGGGDNTPPEVPRPDAVHHHTCSERMIRLGQPESKCFARIRHRVRLSRLNRARRAENEGNPAVTCSWGRPISPRERICTAGTTSG